MGLRSRRRGVGPPSAYLLLMEELPLDWQGVPAGVEVWDTAKSGIREVRRGWFVGSIGDVSRGEGRL